MLDMEGLTAGPCRNRGTWVQDLGRSKRPLVASNKSCFNTLVFISMCGAVQSYRFVSTRQFHQEHNGFLPRMVCQSSQVDMFAVCETSMQPAVVWPRHEPQLGSLRQVSSRALPCRYREI
jgi:hypothetical protein